MHPILFRFAHPLDGRLIEIHSYGVLILAGFAAGYLLVHWNARQRVLTIDRREILWLTGIVLACSMAGAKIFDVLVMLPDIIVSGWSLLDAFTGGGFMFYGGVAGALIGFVWYCRAHRLDLPAWLDLYAPALALGQVFGRMGCFMAGCCYGAPTDCPLGLVFDHPDNAVTPRGLALHPTQVYEAGFALVLFVLLQVLWRRRRPRIPGGLMAVWVFGYAVFRFGVEFIRFDPRGGLLLGLLTPSQVISLLLIAGLAAWLGRLHTRRCPG